MTDDEFRAFVLQARHLAAPVGPMHAMWDVIFDAEAFLENRKRIVDDRVHIEETLKRFCGWTPPEVNP